jgi:phosphoribosyl 1,2-cyclic phosphate phosphodiesterase
MGFPDVIQIKKRMLESGAADSRTVFIVSHFSHNGGMGLDELNRTAESEGFIAAYDGMELTL